MFFMLNLYFYSSWLSLPINMCFIMFHDHLGGFSYFREVNCLLQISKFGFKLAKPLFVGSFQSDVDHSTVNSDVLRSWS